MLKSKVFINVLLVLTILLYLHPIDNSIAGSCDENASSGSTPTFTGNFNIPSNWSCTEDPNFKYDTVNSAETIARNGSANLVVIGNNGPYTWSVFGKGFWFDAAHSITSIQTTGVNATIYADGSACGAATITVTDCNGGTPETGYVRSEDGKWVQIDTCGVAVGHERCSITVGKYRYDQEWCALCPGDNRSCEEACEYGDCGGVFCNASHYICPGSETWCWARFKATFEWRCN